MSAANMNAIPELTIVHKFNAPKKLVFDAFSNIDALSQWWGPVECKTTPLKLEFKTGGVFHYRMEKDGSISYGRFTFGEIRPYDLLEFTNAFSDEKGNIVRAPFDIPLPLKIFYRLIFTESAGKTTLTLTGYPVEASDVEILTFRSINENVQEGFGGTFSKLALYLTQIPKEINH